MNTYDPHVVTRALDDLPTDRIRWAIIAVAALSAARADQQHAREALEQSLQQVAIVEDQAERYALGVQAMAGAMAEQVRRCTDAVEAAQDTIRATQASHTMAIATIEHWQQQLLIVLEWLACAEDCLAVAVRQLQITEQALLEAERALACARAALWASDRGTAGRARKRAAWASGLHMAMLVTAVVG